MRLVLPLILLLQVAGQARGQAPNDPFRFVVWPVEDVRALTGSVSTRTVIAVTGAAAIVGVSARFDDQFAGPARRWDGSPVLRVAQELGHARAMRPALAVLFLGSLMQNDTRLQDASFTGLEAVIVANLVTNSFKAAFGRSRPYEGDGSRRFAPFSGHRSFPSGHATTAFAALTPFARYYGGVPAVVLYGAAAATAFSRMAIGVHWFSDVLAGSAIGFATASALTRLHRGRIRLSAGPGGAVLAVRL
ncbi:MAG: phosphatase PAP2 family protein [Rhodothermales bacterium]|nr:phosphatase PAP2 family protein [Rhodothermales bacterium]MBO6780563.1 phosphatase PAP2 family protein [Rhodothermales bacterium]